MLSGQIFSTCVSEQAEEFGAKVTAAVAIYNAVVVRIVKAIHSRRLCFWVRRRRPPKLPTTTARGVHVSRQQEKIANTSRAKALFVLGATICIRRTKDGKASSLPFANKSDHSVGDPQGIFEKNEPTAHTLIYEKQQGSQTPPGRHVHVDSEV
ncbi:unnamed protein product [Caenorhabditis auriculariae]|uniref:Uncharacterized protein n=1 Tax=Caenorhabditis auriculariae TaxID=2777116 RepID=A0A8S1GX79_9PELO|nr:unnamed protein product [Caenorhabditis auriculariae]